MSISNAMASGVAGLLANSTAVEKISYNIANADTVGYRRSFSQMVTAGSSPTSGAGATGVKTATSHTNTTDGSYQSTSLASNLAISGNGFFVVSSNLNSVGTQSMFTRVGSFEPDELGYLRNAAGNYLMGFAYDENGSLGSVDRSSGSSLVPVNIANKSIGGTATSASAGVSTAS